METSYIVSFIGDDRPGLVEELSSVIRAAGGNWHESRLSQLQGKFAGLILVALPQDAAAELEDQLKALSASGLSVRVTATESRIALAESRRIQLSVMGPDRQGIVLEISRALAAHGFNVVEMDSEVASTSIESSVLTVFSADVKRWQEKS